MITFPITFFRQQLQEKLFQVKVWPDSENTYNIPLTIELLPLRYNKKHAITYEMDDTLKLIYTNVFKLFNGGTPVSDTLASEGLCFTNGFGTPVKFRGSSVGNMFFSNGTNILSYNYPNSALLTWPLLEEMYNAGWGLMGNHGAFMNYSNVSVEDMISWETQFKQEFEAKYKRSPLFAVLQGGVSNFDSAAWIDWLIQNCSIYLKVMGSGGAANTIDLSNLKLVEYINNNQTVMQTGRFNMDGSLTTQSIISTIDAFMNRSGNWWFRMFSHNVENNTNLTEYSKFKEVFRHIESAYGKDGLDNVWIPSVTELIEYLVTKEKAVVTSQFAEQDTYNVSFDFSQVPANIFNRSLTFKITCELPFKQVICRGYQANYSGINTNTLIVDLQNSI